MKEVWKKGRCWRRRDCVGVHTPAELTPRLIGPGNNASIVKSVTEIGVFFLMYIQPRCHLYHFSSVACRRSACALSRGTRYTLALSAEVPNLSFSVSG